MGNKEEQESGVIPEDLEERVDRAIREVLQRVGEDPDEFLGTKNGQEAKRLACGRARYEIEEGLDKPYFSDPFLNLPGSEQRVQFIVHRWAKSVLYYLALERVGITDYVERISQARAKAKSEGWDQVRWETFALFEGHVGPMYGDRLREEHSRVWSRLLRQLTESELQDLMSRQLSETERHITIGALLGNRLMDDFTTGRLWIRDVPEGSIAISGLLSSSPPRPLKPRWLGESREIGFWNLLDGLGAGDVPAREVIDLYRDWEQGEKGQLRKGRSYKRLDLLLRILFYNQSMRVLVGESLFDLNERAREGDDDALLCLLRRIEEYAQFDWVGQRGAKAIREKDGKFLRRIADALDRKKPSTEWHGFIRALMGERELHDSAEQKSFRKWYVHMYWPLLRGLSRHQIEHRLVKVFQTVGAVPDDFGSFERDMRRWRLKRADKS